MSEWEQCLDALWPDDELKNLAEDFRGTNRLGCVTYVVTIIVSGQYTRRWRSDRAYLLLASATAMVGGGRGQRATRRRVYLHLGSRIRMARAFAASMDCFGSRVSKITLSILVGS